MKIDLSIIIPIFKSEKYIERCVRSLMEQTLQDKIEFIFIDDATPDSSMDVLNRVISEYPKRKDQIIIIHNSTNLGITETRKVGIQVAKGEYIGWCDSDDWCEFDMFESMLRKAKEFKYDIVVCNAWIHDVVKGENHVWEAKKSPKLTPQDVIKDIYQKTSFPNGLWFQISKKELISKAANKLYPVNRSEDTFLMLYCFYFAISAFWLEKSYYHYYCTNVNSITHQNNLTKTEWKGQTINMDNYERMLKKDVNARDYKVAISYIKFFLKQLFRNSFTSCWDYWSTYKEAYKDICYLTNTPKNKRWKVWLTYNFYPLYWLKFRKERTY